MAIPRQIEALNSWDLPGVESYPVPTRHAVWEDSAMRRFALLLGFAFSLFTTSAIAQNCDGFTDVLASSPFCPDVTWLKTYGVTKGCAATHYLSDENVTRLQMAAFMHRLGENPAFVNGGNAFGGGAVRYTDYNPLVLIVDAQPAIIVQPAVDSIFYG